MIVEAIQGKSNEDKKVKNEFWRTAKKPPLEFLLSTAEEHARTLGFEEIKIRRPELYIITKILLPQKILK